MAVAKTSEMTKTSSVLSNNQHKHRHNLHQMNRSILLSTAKLRISTYYERCLK